MLKLKIARPDKIHYASLASIYNQYISVATMDTVVRDENYFSKMIADFDSTECILSLFEDDQMIGWGSIKKYSHKEGYRYTGETSVFMHPDKRGLGFGKKIKIAVINEAKSMGYKHLIAKIWASNQSSIQYNLKLGYTIVGTQKKIGNVNGEWIDVVILQYLIE